MLMIQNLFKNAYFCIKSIAKKLYKCCAVFASGFTVFALLLLNNQNVYGKGKNVTAQEPIVLFQIEEKLKREDGEAAHVLEGNLGLTCRDVLEISPTHVREEVKAVIS